jgi:cytochrome bd-type quinol oxidase subunit 2
MSAEAIGVLIATAAVLYGACFVAATRRTRAGSGPARAAAFATSGVAIFALVPAVLFAAFIDALRCDENCNENLIASARTPGWRNYTHTWQWDAQLEAIAGALLLVLVATVLVGLRRERAAAAIAVCAVACVCVWTAIIGST